MDRSESGGLSGKPLKDRSTATIRRIYQLTNGEVPIIGVGGISSGEDAYEKVKNGASLVQLYSSLVYGGPGLVKEIKESLSDCLKRDGYANIRDAVGVEAKAK